MSVCMVRYDEALDELEALKCFAPKESSVYFLMGQIYKRTGDVLKSMSHLNVALDLDPKGGNFIKAALDKLHVPDPPDDDLLPSPMLS